MAVKKATSAARRTVPPKQAAPTKAAARKTTKKASATKMTATKASATRGAAKSATGANGAKVSGTKPATGAGTRRTSAAKVTATKSARSNGAKTTATKPSRSNGARATATKPATRAKASADAEVAAGPRSRGAGYPTRPSVPPQRLRVRENEKPWTAKELATVRAELEADIARLQKEISVAELDLAGLMRDIGDGAGDDPADAGTATFEREQEISLANNAREVFEQSARALARLLDGSYGICESCGSPIGKNRLLAFPRATLCMTCKSKQERR
jgi:RNA polymerase-binding transcription factor DksA